MSNWIRESGSDYIAFTEGVYYAVNNAIVYRISKKELVQRNTYTGKELVIATNISKKDALKRMKEIIKHDIKRL